MKETNGVSMKLILNQDTEFIPLKRILMLTPENCTDFFFYLYYFSCQAETTEILEFDENTSLLNGMLSAGNAFLGYLLRQKMELFS